MEVEALTTGQPSSVQFSHSVVSDSVIRWTAARKSHKFSLSFPFWLPHKACGIFAPQPGIEPIPPVGEAPSLNHWVARNVPSLANLRMKMTQVLCILFMADAAVDKKKKATILLLYSYFHQVVDGNTLVLFLGHFIFFSSFLLLLYVLSLLRYGLIFFASDKDGRYDYISISMKLPSLRRTVSGSFVGQRLRLQRECLRARVRVA